VLDPALLRPAASTARSSCPTRTSSAARKILKVHVRKVPLAPGVNLKTIARGTPDFPAPT
jgi:cell division protease FtsH